MYHLKKKLMQWTANFTNQYFENLMTETRLKNSWQTSGDWGEQLLDLGERNVSCSCLIDDASCSAVLFGFMMSRMLWVGERFVQASSAPGPFCYEESRSRSFMNLKWALPQRRRRCFWIMFTHGCSFAWLSFNLHLQTFPEPMMSWFPWLRSPRITGIQYWFSDQISHCWWWDIQSLQS